MNEEDEELVESTESVETLYQMAAAENPQDEDLLYLMQGVDSDRDRKLTLAALLAWIVGKGGGVDAVLKSLQFNKPDAQAGENKRTDIDGEGMTIAADVSDGQGGSVEDPEKGVFTRHYVHYTKLTPGGKLDAYFMPDKVQIDYTPEGESTPSLSTVVESDKITAPKFVGKHVGETVVGNATDGFLSILSGRINREKNNEITTDMQFTDDGLGFAGRVSVERMNQNYNKIISEALASTTINLYNRFVLDDLPCMIGDIVMVKNDHSIAQAQRVYIQPGYYVDISPMCSMLFMCVDPISGQTGQYRWSPIGNATVSIDPQS